jgi:hypothetical protein
MIFVRKTMVNPSGNSTVCYGIHGPDDFLGMMVIQYYSLNEIAYLINDYS